MERYRSLRRQELVKVEKADAMERWVAIAAGVRLPREITFEEICARGEVLESRLIWFCPVESNL